MRRQSRRNLAEAAVNWFFRLATYSVILAAGYIFLNITINGSKAVFTSKAPFINIAFLTEKPQTLHVFEPIKITDQLAANRSQIVALQSESDLLGAGHKNRKIAIKETIRELEQTNRALDKERKELRFTYSDHEYRKLALPPSAAEFRYSSYAYSGGGVGPAIIGTSLLVSGSIVIALALGVLCAIYLSEYSRSGRLLYTIRLSILNLAGVPSIVFGLFGFGMFVLFFNCGVSMIAGWFTLALMAMPVVIAASEESIRSVPNGYREGALALGASKWTSIRTNVLPYALPGILTSSIMSVARVAGETAPIMFTAAFALSDELPWQGLDHWYDFFFKGVMALPYHIYVVSSKLPQNEYTRNMQYGAAFVFLVIVGFFALSSILLRLRVSKKYESS